jgi:hypothetical protein
MDSTLVQLALDAYQDSRAYDELIGPDRLPD